MSVPRYAKSKTVPGEIKDLAAERVILVGVPEEIIIDVVEALNAAYNSGVRDGAASERIGTHPAAIGRAAEAILDEFGNHLQEIAWAAVKAAACQTPAGG